MVVKKPSGDGLHETLALLELRGISEDELCEIDANRVRLI